MRMGKSAKRKIAVCMLVLLGSMQICHINAAAAGAPKTIGLEQAKKMALTNNSSYRKAKSKLVMQSVKYKQALKAISLKQKNMSTFRWTPLLSFKLPEKANLTDEAEYIYKPLQIQTETKAIEHSLTDIVYQSQETISNLYVDLYTQQETITFYEKRIEDTEITLRRNKARLMTGEAYQADVDSMEKKLTELKTKLSAQMRSYENNKVKMGDLIGLDVTSGYQFSNPYVEAVIERRDLKEIIEHTLEEDQQFYEVKLEAAAGLMTLNSNYKLMHNQYGSNMNRIAGYINQVKRGEKLDADSFKNQYDELLVDVDRPWQGNFRILFIRFPKEWLKGQISGVRYVEDDPYLLYTNALEYQDMLEEQKQTEKELRKSVADGYENLITAHNSYSAMQKQSAELQQEVLRATKQNLVGETTWEDLEVLQEELEEAKMDELDALSTYSQFLYSYDRLTCGAITALLRGKEIDMGSIEGGISYITEDIAEGACYYIRTKIEDNVFDLGIYIPDGYELALTDYELWCDGVKVGERTAIDQTIRHLLLDLQEVERVFIRFYDGEEYIDDCEINTQEYSGPLAIIKEYLVEKEPDDIWGTYTYYLHPQTNLLTIKLEGKETRGIAYYGIQEEQGKPLLSEELIEIGQEFSYLGLVEQDLENLVIRLYDKDKKQLTMAYFNRQDGQIHGSSDG